MAEEQMLDIDDGELRLPDARHALQPAHHCNVHYHALDVHLQMMTVMKIPHSIRSVWSTILLSSDAMENVNAGN